MNKYMEKAIEEARLGIHNHDGGPFGAVIVKDGNIIASSHNTVLKSNDPTAHGEVNAIREASKILNTHDLSGCILYTTAQPCPMCLSAIIWANIKEVYYGSDFKHTALIGFRDEDIYDYIKGKNNMIKLKQIDSFECDKVQDEYNDKIY